MPPPIISNRPQFIPACPEEVRINAFTPRMFLSGITISYPLYKWIFVALHHAHPHTLFLAKIALALGTMTPILWVILGIGVALFVLSTLDYLRQHKKEELGHFAKEALVAAIFVVGLPVLVAIMLGLTVAIAGLALVGGSLYLIVGAIIEGWPRSLEAGQQRWGTTSGTQQY